MKKVFAIAAIVCVVNFILFGISQCVGYLSTGRFGGTNSSVYVDQISSSREMLIFDQQVTDGKKDWKINDEFPNIHLNTSGIKVIVDQWDGDQIAVSADVTNGGKAKVSAYYNTSTNNLTITAARPDISFDDASKFGVVNWLEDIFGNNGAVVTIKFPQNIYENLEIKHGSGELFVSDFYARNNNISVGSGTFAFGGNSDFRANLFNLSLTSGKVSVDNISSEIVSLTGNSGKLYCSFAENAQQARNFLLELNSGTAAVKNVSAADCELDIGSGKFFGDIKADNLTMKQGSGSSEIALAELTANADIDVGSGKVNLYLPESGGEVFPSIGSGSVKIDAYNVKANLSGGDNDLTYVVGAEDAVIGVNLNSGTVGIYEYENRSAFPDDFDELSDLRRSVSANLVDTGSDYEPAPDTASGIVSITSGFESTTIPESEITSVSVESSAPVEVSDISEVSEVSGESEVSP